MGNKFDRTKRLLGAHAMEKLKNSHVAVFGIGGVGDGLRHHITPIISYRYIPNAEQGSSRIPIVDDFDVDDYTYPPILDLGEIRNTDRIFKTNVLRLGLENVLETRDETYGSREIARFDVFQDFNFEERPLAQNHLEESSFSDLYTNFSLS
ncbi:MAG: LPS assembly protein LptD, partial [Agathobacter sp.]|nr:LPS assembly protein LptD [Agathobacter sp.]